MSELRETVENAIDGFMLDHPEGAGVECVGELTSVVVAAIEAERRSGSIPRLTSARAHQITARFAGGHTPAIRDALISLERAAAAGEGKR